MFNNKNIYLILAIFVALILTTTNCSKSNTISTFKYDGEYQTVIIYEGIAHFSLEVPAYFTLDLTDTTDDMTSVVVDGVLRDGNYYENSIAVYVHKYNDFYRSADYVFKQELSIVKKLPKFRLIEKLRVTFLGQPAQKLVYYCERLTDKPRVYVSGTDIMFVFDYDGMVWELRMGSSEDKSDQGQYFFDHIVQTFKILD